MTELDLTRSLADGPEQWRSSSEMIDKGKETGRSRAKRILLLVVGTFFLVVGVIGIVLPLLPTTPFLLLAAGCYLRGSTRFYNWLLGTRWLGDYIRNYLEGRGIPLRAKVFSIALLWITIGTSAAFAIDLLAIRVLLGVIAVGVTWHILRIRTLKR